MSQVLIATKGRNEATILPKLSDEEVKSFNSIADAIRYVHNKYPTASNGSIAKLLTNYHTKPIRPQHVYNVLHQVLKGK